jgi:lysophospholipid acyltransferase (LPLAT)-like uncharacterized protein
MAEPGPTTAPGSSTAPPKKRKSGVVVPHPPTWLQRLGAGLIFLVLRAVALSLRYRWSDPTGTMQNPPAGPLIFCIWHNRLAICMEAYRAFRRQHPRAGMAAIVSASRDGGLLTGVLECFRVQPVRGSSSRRGPQALLELVSWSERGLDLAVTPDGPRGPRYMVQEGVMAAAQLTGLPVIPFSAHVRWKIQAKSWDRFQIPLPFSLCEMNIGPPMWVPREATDAEREALRLQLERTLNELSKD